MLESVAGTGMREYRKGVMRAPRQPGPEGRRHRV